MAPRCNSLNAKRHFTKAEANPPRWSAGIITSWLFDTNQTPHKRHRKEKERQTGRRRKTLYERQEAGERRVVKERQQDGQRVKDSGILPLSQLAGFKVISRVLPCSFSLALLPPLDVLLTARSLPGSQEARSGLASVYWAPFRFQTLPMKDDSEPVVHVRHGVSWGHRSPGRFPQKSLVCHYSTIHLRVDRT